jgi:hypothetical protein
MDVLFVAANSSGVLGSGCRSDVAFKKDATVALDA